MKIKAAILDDEINSIKALEYEVKTNCPDVQIITTFQDPTEALSTLSKLDIDLLFLDISMPVMDGFEFLKKMSNRPFEVVFTTAYNQYALQAFKASALDYLVKPIDGEELVEAVLRVKNRLQDRDSLLTSIQEKLHKMKQDKDALVSFPVMEGLELVRMSSIIYCHADGNYTEIYLENRKPLIISKTLKEIESLLDPELFCRVHNSYLINLKKISKYIKQDGGYILMSNGDEVKISRQKKDAFLSRI